MSAPENADVIVLGAGIVGVSTALHLQKRGRSVVLVDRRGAGEETSYGNTGIIQREGVVPYPFPRQLGLMAQYALNMRAEAKAASDAARCCTADCIDEKRARSSALGTRLISVLYETLRKPLAIMNSTKIAITGSAGGKRTKPR